LKKTIITTATLLCAFFVTANSALAWKSLAYTPVGQWAWDYGHLYEEDARKAAILKCAYSFGPCNPGVSIQEHWTGVLANCNGVLITAGSEYGASGALVVAAKKVGMPRGSCLALTYF